MGSEVTVRHRDAAIVVSKRVAVTLPEIGPVLGIAFGEVYGHLGAGETGAAGPPFVIYEGMPGTDAPFDIEICAPVTRATEPPAGWRVRVLPAGLFASLTHVGPYDTVAAAYDELSAWIPAHDLAVAGPPREVYLSDPATPPDRIRTVIEWPVTPATVGAAGPT
jgi:effector-binding domain-containing protein